MDLSFLRMLAAGHLPRRVPPGPALNLVIAYKDAGFIDADVPPRVETRSGTYLQPDAIVLSILNDGWVALEMQAKAD